MSSYVNIAQSMWMHEARNGDMGNGTANATYYSNYDSRHSPHENANCCGKMLFLRNDSWKFSYRQPANVDFSQRQSDIQISIHWLTARFVVSSGVWRVFKDFLGLMRLQYLLEPQITRWFLHQWKHLVWSVLLHVNTRHQSQTTAASCGEKR